MNDYEIGAALRERLQREQQQGMTPDGRRLQALVGDLCGDDPRLLPAMRYLVNWEPFLREASRRPPLTDPRLAPRLRQELREIFAMPVCERMDAVVGGLLNLRDRPAPQRAEKPPTPSPPESAATEERRGSPASVVVLCLGAFFGGGLLALVVGLLIPLRQEPPADRLGEPAIPEASLAPGPAGTAAVATRGRA